MGNDDNVDLISQTSSLSQDSLTEEAAMPRHTQQQTQQYRQSIDNEQIKSQLIHLNDSVSYAKIKAVKLNNSKHYLHPVDAESFAKFEAGIYDLLGFTAADHFKLPDINSNSNNTSAANYAAAELNPIHDAIKLENLASKQKSVKSQLIADMSIVHEHLEMNPFNQIQLKREIIDTTRFRQAERRNTLMESSIEANVKVSLRPRLATIILNQSVRPRKSMRILLTKKNAANLDTVLNELMYLFKLDTPIKRIYNLNGDQVNQIKWIF